MDDWMQILNECRKATLGNAVLGEALVGRIKSVGTAFEKEMEKALEEAQQQALQLEKIREEKWNLKMEHLQMEQRGGEAINSKMNEVLSLKSERENSQAQS